MSDIRNDEYNDAAGRINGRFYENGHSKQARIFTDILGWGLWVGRYCEHRFAGMGHEDAIRAVENEICTTEGKPLPFPPAPTPEPIPGRTGRVKLVNRVMLDDLGPEPFLGTSLFWAAWGAKNDKLRLLDNLIWLSKRGVHYIRVLAEVGGGNWSDRTVDPRDAGWTRQLQDTVLLAKDCGLRVEWTIFGGGVLKTEADFDHYTDVFIDAMRPYVDRIQFAEIRNEQQGPSDAQARTLASKVRAQLGCLVAICGTPEQGLDAIYGGSQASLLTLHCSRDYRERGYRPIRQIKHELQWRGPWVNNEPIGIASSGVSDDDPMRLAAGAVTTWVVGSCAHNLHTGAGIYGKAYMGPTGPRTANVWEQPTLEPTLALIAEAKKRLPADLPNWERKTHGAQGHPLKFNTAVGDEVEAGADGSRWVCFLAGIRNRVEFTITSPCSLWSLGNGRVEHVGPGTYALSEAEWGPCVLLTSE
jgi:hypothetical protein